MTTFQELKEESTKENKSILNVLREKTEEVWDTFRDKKNMKRFGADLDREIEDRERKIEDSEEKLIDALRDASIKSKTQRLDLVRRIDSIKLEIEEYRDEILRLSQFREEYL